MNMGRNKRNDKQREERLGETRANNQGALMKIIEYITNDNILVEFEDGYKKHTTYDNFSHGVVRNPNVKIPVVNCQKENRLGEYGINNQGDKMFIKEYVNSYDIIVEFCDEYHGRVHTDYKRFKEGGVKNPYRPGVYGEITGNEFPCRINGVKTKEYNTWRSILSRVFNKKTNEKTKAYHNVTVCKEWMFFPNFVKWLMEQPNYEKWKNSNNEWDIDKDILSSLDNKVYSPNTCCLVPKKINQIIIDSSKKDKKNNLPIGVTKHSKKYYCKIKDVSIGFDTPNEAYLEYIKYKNEDRQNIAKSYYQKGEITQKCYEALMDENFLFR